MNHATQSAVLWFTLWTLVAAALGQIIRLLVKAIRLLDSIVTVVKDVQDLKATWTAHRELHRAEGRPVPSTTTTGA